MFRWHHHTAVLVDVDVGGRSAGASVDHRGCPEPASPETPAQVKPLDHEDSSANIAAWARRVMRHLVAELVACMRDVEIGSGLSRPSRTTPFLIVEVWRRLSAPASASSASLIGVRACTPVRLFTKFPRYASRALSRYRGGGSSKTPAC